MTDTTTTTAAADVAAMETADHPRVIPPDPTTRRKRTTRAINCRRRLPSSPSEGRYEICLAEGAQEQRCQYSGKNKTLHQVPVAAAAAATIEDGIFDSMVPDIVVASVNYSNLYCPLYDGMSMGMPFGLSSAFSPDLPVNFIDENVASSSAAAAAAAEPFKSIRAIEDLFLRDFP